jgi:3-deoxy-D-manno-octulosonic-acid transferase
LFANEQISRPVFADQQVHSARSLQRVETAFAGGCVSLISLQMPLLYTIIYSLGFVLLSPVFLYKMWKRGKYRENFLQRFGFYERDVRQRLARKRHQRCWIQAVSVGEVNVAFTLINALQEKFPTLDIVLSTTTSTGYTLAYERLPKEVELIYFPQDFPWCVRRAYDLVQPDLVVLMESEVWPNHVWAGAQRGAPLMIVNGRMSPRSARRYRKAGWLFADVLKRLSLICMQTQEDAENICAAGARREIVHVTGNMKYDASMPYADVQKVDAAQLLKQIGCSSQQPIIVAGSTHPGEEEILFDIFAELRRNMPELFLVIAPRHVERMSQVIEVANRKQIKFVLRSEINSQLLPSAKPYDCLLINTTGELRWFYKVATVIFVGKSLAGRGGQNIVEAAASDHPVVFGPHMENFKAIARQFVVAGGSLQVKDAADLRRTLDQLLHSPNHRAEIVSAARRVIQANLGATDRTMELLAGVMKSIHR